MLKAEFYYHQIVKASARSQSDHLVNRMEAAMDAALSITADGVNILWPTHGSEAFMTAHNIVATYSDKSFLTFTQVTSGADRTVT